MRNGLPFRYSDLGPEDEPERCEDCGAWQEFCTCEALEDDDSEYSDVKEHGYHER